MNAPTLRILSLGAGVQSTTLALMACDGTLPGLDGAIFADTGWEPKAVYAQLDRLSHELNTAAIPLHKVSRGGSIRDDVLNPYVFATIPTQVLNPDGTVGKVLRQCTGKYKVEPVERKIRELLGAPVRDIECRYCGGTGERAAPWLLKNTIEEATAAARATAILAGGETVPVVGECSVCRGTGIRRLVGSVSKGVTAEQWIGFSTDEIHRVSGNKFPAHATPRFPLIELDMSRKDCQRWLNNRGWTVAKSACIGCPYHGNRHWREMRDQLPEEWADAVEFDKAIRVTPGVAGQRFLHASLKPLDEAPIDHKTRSEYAEDQLDMFEDGDPDGCSPYGCRSGAPVELEAS